MKSELIESPWWMRLTASPSRRATEKTLTFSQARTCSRGGIVSVMMSSWMGEALMRVMDCGLKDSFRKHTEQGGQYTWWDFRTRAFQQGSGLRIDHALMSPPAFKACTAVEIDVEARKGEKPSDHAPVIATLG